MPKKRIKIELHLSKRKITISERITSGFIGTATGTLVGWSIGGTVATLLEFTLLPTVIIFMVLMAALGLYMDIKFPKVIEAISFGLTILIFTQAWWDRGANDWNQWRTVMTLSAIGLFLLNIFTGALRVRASRKIGARTFGLDTR